MKIKTLVPTTALLTVLAGVAVAQQQPAQPDDQQHATQQRQSQSQSQSGAARSQSEQSRAAASTTRSPSEASAERGSDEHPDFATADTDKDGLLSITELKAALPDVDIMDENADGFVNQSEAESGITGLAFESGGFTGGSSLVSEPEYGLMVSTLGGDGNAATGARSGAGAAGAGAGGNAGDSGERGDRGATDRN